MTSEEFATFQQQDARSALSHLVERCARRYLTAARLVHLRGPVVARLGRTMSDGRVDLMPLLPAWQLICDRYREDRFAPQSSLFEDHDSDALERWGRFVHWELFPWLLQDDELVRNVLRAVELLPCSSPADAASALTVHLSEMWLPDGAPTLNPEDV